MQILPLLPGFSRTGSTIAGGLMVGLAHEDALRFSFLLATPIIGAAAALKLPVLFASRDARAIEPALLGAICAAIASYVWSEPHGLGSSQAGDWTEVWAFSSSNRTGER